MVCNIIVSNRYCVVTVRFCLIIHQVYNLGSMSLLVINTFDTRHNLSQGTRFSGQKHGPWSHVFRILPCQVLGNLLKISEASLYMCVYMHVCGGFFVLFLSKKE